MEKFWCEGSLKKEDLGEMLLMMIKRSGLSDKEFADKIGCPVNNVVISKNGKGAHIFSTLEKAVETFGYKTVVTISEI